MSLQVVDFCACLPGREIVEISGPDREVFLQGVVTQNVKLLREQLIIYSLLLSPQGKFQYDFFIVNAGDSWLIDIDKGRAQALAQRLQLFKLHAKISIKLNPSWRVGVSSAIGQAKYCFTDPRLKNLGYRLYDQTLPVTQTPVKIYENLRLSLGVPDGAHDMIIDKSIPLEWGMDELNAISWDKGCYLGQELTARSRYVGQVRKRAFPIEFTNQTSFTTGAKLYSGANEVGELRTHNGKFGIALLRLEALHHSEAIVIDTQPVKVHQPSWMKLPQ